MMSGGLSADAQWAGEAGPFPASVALIAPAIDFGALASVRLRTNRLPE
jgi:hypothetical protein